MKRIYLLLALALFGLSGPASATFVTYEFSGDVPCAVTGQPSCGDYSAELTINDAQVGTAGSGGSWIYEVSDVAYSFTGGGNYSAQASYIVAFTTGLNNTQVSITIQDELVTISNYWQFDTGGIDNSDLAALILLLTTDSSEPLDETILSDLAYDCDPCEPGGVTLWSPATAASTIPTLPLLAVGLAGLGYARRRSVTVR